MQVKRDRSFSKKEKSNRGKEKGLIHIFKTDNKQEGGEEEILVIVSVN